MKGGTTGGSHSQVVPMDGINLHVTGDFHAISLAHNLLASMIDNHIHQGNEHAFDIHRIPLNRVVDLNDRSLRKIIIGAFGDVSRSDELVQPPLQGNRSSPR